MRLLPVIQAMMMEEMWVPSGQTDHRVCPLQGWGFLSRGCHISIPAGRGTASS